MHIIGAKAVMLWSLQWSPGEGGEGSVCSNWERIWELWSFTQMFMTTEFVAAPYIKSVCLPKIHIWETKSMLDLSLSELAVSTSDLCPKPKAVLAAECLLIRVSWKVCQPGRYDFKGTVPPRDQKHIFVRLHVVLFIRQDRFNVSC